MRTHEFAIVQTTTDTAQEADQLASGAIEQQIAGCVQISHITSYYRWHGQAQHDPEFLLTFKTTAAAVETVKDYLATHHSYEEPEIIVIPIVDGSQGYLQWISGSVLASKNQ